MKILYISDYSSRTFTAKEDCEKFENDLRSKMEEWAKKSAESKLDKLIFELKEESFIPIGTIATCSYESLAIKRMVKVCQKFVEENKEYLNNY